MLATRCMRGFNRVEVEDISTQSPQIVDLTLLAMKTSPTLPPFDHLLTYLPASCTIRAGDIVRIGIPWWLTITPTSIISVVWIHSFLGKCVDPLFLMYEKVWINLFLARQGVDPLN